MLMITIRKGANLFASIVVSRLIGLAIAKHSMVPKTLASARLQTIEIVSGSCSVTMRGPASTPHMVSPPSRTAIEPLVGPLKSSVGMSLPPSLALLQLSGAVTATLAPFPNWLLSRGVALVRKYGNHFPVV